MDTCTSGENRKGNSSTSLSYNFLIWVILLTVQTQSETRRQWSLENYGAENTGKPPELYRAEQGGKFMEGLEGQWQRISIDAEYVLIVLSVLQ